MTNYEKLISSVLLSMVLSGQAFGLGCDCGCSDDGSDDEDGYSPDIDLAQHSNSTKVFTQWETGPTAVATLVGKIKENCLDGVLQLYVLRDPKNDIDSRQEVSEAVVDLFDWQINEINKKIKEFFGVRNVKTIENVSIKDLGEVEQMQMIGLMLGVLDCFYNQEVTLDDFSRNLLYSFRKKSFNNAISVAKDLKIKEKSDIKDLFLIVRNSIFESLCKYVYEYLNLGYEKFGSAFYNKDINNEVNFAQKASNFYAAKNGSDKNEYLSKFLKDKDLGAIKLSDIGYIEGQLLSLPVFNDVFVLNSRNYKLSSDDVTAIKAYKTFAQSILDTYNLQQISKAKGHLWALLNFFNGTTKGKNDPNNSNRNVTKTVFDLADVNDIDQETTFSFKNGLKVDNIVFAY